ncbi:MAG TPA: OmpA family protein [Polyangia bacterium]|jgi:peptidoglycan-associated lipoprotein
MKAHGWFVLSCLVSVVSAFGCSHQTPPAVQAPTAAENPPATKAAPVVARAETPPPTMQSKNPASIYFDFDSSLLGDGARDTLAKVATKLKDHDATAISVQGNCDELGTVEYNLALGQQRADAAKQYLVRMGVDPHKVQTASYGSQRPLYPGHDDSSRAKNRRDDIVYP